MKDILSSLGYNLILAASEVNEEEEHYIYDFISLISECGGSLGLFLGFSFFMVLDYLTPTLMIVKKLSNKNCCETNLYPVNIIIIVY